MELLGAACVSPRIVLLAALGLFPHPFLEPPRRLVVSHINAINTTTKFAWARLGRYDDVVTAQAGKIGAACCPQNVCIGRLDVLPFIHIYSLKYVSKTAS